MREIKFRAWDNENKCWYKPIHEAYAGNLYELLITFNGDLIAHTMNGLDHESLWPERYVLMQYTGLKDKNGKEIYEGDILQMYEYPPFVMEWVISHSGVGWTLFAPKHEVKVIGNIYENPELLSGK